MDCEPPPTPTYSGHWRNPADTFTSAAPGEDIVMHIAAEQDVDLVVVVVGTP